MNCPDCRSENTRVLDTFKGDIERRQRKCQCGVTFKTTEMVEKGSIRRLPVPISRDITEPIANRSQPVATERPQNGNPVSLSSDPISLRTVSDPSVGRDQDPDPARVYDPAFLDFWDVIDPIGRRKGDKADAQKVWKKKGCPSPTVLISGWTRYRVSCGDGFTMDADKWLRNDGWKKEYEPAPRSRTKAPDLRCDWHRTNDGKPSKFPKDGCPRCKHFTARGAKREGEPTDIGDFMADMNRKAEEAAAREKSEHAERFQRDREADQHKEQHV